MGLGVQRQQLFDAITLANLKYIERRLSKERFTIALLQFMSAPKGSIFALGHWNWTRSLDPGLSDFRFRR
jgi:hypothetical protein